MYVYTPHTQACIYTPHTHTHTHVYIRYMYTHTHTCVCVCMVYTSRGIGSALTNSQPINGLLGGFNVPDLEMTHHKIGPVSN